MSQLQLRQFGLYFDSFLPHSSSYEPANESISTLKFPDFRNGPDNTIDFNALPKSKQKMPIAGSGHLAYDAGLLLISYLQVIRARAEPSQRLTLDLKRLQSLRF